MKEKLTDVRIDSDSHSHLIVVPERENRENIREEIIEDLAK